MLMVRQLTFACPFLADHKQVKCGSAYILVTDSVELSILMEASRFHRAMTRPFFTREHISDFDIYDKNCVQGLD